LMQYLESEGLACETNYDCHYDCKFGGGGNWLTTLRDVAKIPGFSLKLDREVENHSEETKITLRGTKFPLIWLEEWKITAKNAHIPATLTISSGENPGFCNAQQSSFHVTEGDEVNNTRRSRLQKPVIADCSDLAD
jgi:hypothetical protein